MYEPQRNSQWVVLVRRRGRCKGGIGQLSADRTEALAVAGATREGLEIAYAPVASDMHAAHEHLAVLGAGMPAPVAERRVLAVRACLKRSPCAGKLVAAVSA